MVYVQPFVTHRPRTDGSDSINTARLLVRLRADTARPRHSSTAATAPHPAPPPAKVSTHFVLCLIAPSAHTRTTAGGYGAPPGGGYGAPPGGAYGAQGGGYGAGGHAGGFAPPGGGGPPPGADPQCAVLAYVRFSAF